MALTMLAGVALAACGSEDRVVVPEVEGLTVEAGVNRVCSRFLLPEIRVTEEAPAGEEPRVVSSDPPVGEEAEVGSTVTLRVIAPAEGFLPAPGCDAE